MSDLLKGIGQGLGGLGLLIGAVAYWTKAQAQRREQTGELMGLLTSVTTEISVNEATLDRLIREPDRLVNPVDRVLETRAWDLNGVRIARLLDDYKGFWTMAEYYEYTQRLREDVRHGAATSEEAENLRENAETCRQKGTYVKSQILRSLSKLLATEYQK